MSENENTTNETPAQPATKESVAKGLLASIAERVAGSNPVVTQRYIDSQVEKEVGDRVNLLDKGMQKRFQCMTELNKVNRPDNETFNADGSLASGTFSKERLKAIKDAKEALAKIEGALEKALGGDWSKLKEQAR
jgi:hypothetical protein